jgi:invasion protein IalB
MTRMTFAMAVALSILASTQPSLAQAAPERSVTTETFESWILACVETGETRACEINQNIADQSGRPIMQLQVGRFNAEVSERAMLARFAVNIMTTMPIVWSAGETSIVLTLRACLDTFCAAEGRVSEEVAAALLRTDPQAQTRFTMTQANGATVSIPLSLTGFADAWMMMLDRTQ